jgi:hypothetical protein
MYKNALNRRDKREQKDLFHCATKHTVESQQSSTRS